MICRYCQKDTIVNIADCCQSCWRNAEKRIETDENLLDLQQTLLNDSDKRQKFNQEWRELYKTGVPIREAIWQIRDKWLEPKTHISKSASNI